MLDKTKPMNLGDIFNITINMIKETFLRNLVIASVFFIPAGIIMAFGFDYIFSLLINSVEAATQEGARSANQHDFGDIFTGIFFYGLAIVGFTICTFGVMIGVTFVGGTALNGKRVSINEAFQKIFSITFFRSIGQIILLGFLFGVMIGIPMIFFALSGISDLKVLAILGVLVLIASLFLMLFFYIRWYFTFTAIVCDDLPVFDSFSKSFSLVKGYWWRTFGLIILISITVQFAISVVTTPVSFIVMWDFFSEYFKLIAGGDFNQNDPSQIFSMFNSFGYSLAIIITISSILQYIIAPLFTVTLYYDLKIRKNDFEGETNPVSEKPTVV